MLVFSCSLRRQGRQSSTTTKSINKILIANRGEIACRVIRTAKKMGISTIAVYSDADMDSIHVKMADEAVHIGAAPSSDSYLKADFILEVAKHYGAQAIHPGYGFLSENAGFAASVEENGISFIGPPASAITAMGSKSASKHIMEAANVPCVPGYHGEDQSVARLKEEAGKIGYPVIFKAVLGGGGKGMRIVDSEEDVEDAIESCRREALKSFGDDRILVEKYLRRPRHVEIQVFADKHGNCVYLFERDCSVQRRHQKIIEEAPAPGLSPELRKQIGEAAVKAARAVGYVGAGTVEFILSQNHEFYFMEMNTRLQVEHPVTEMITKQDLVRWQINVAAGYPLPLTQEQLECHGHAFEARVYAENPRGGFLPGTGKLELLSTPQLSDQVRIDTGVREGDSVSIFYDPMIAKLIVWDVDRTSALRRLIRALSEYKIAPLSTNIEFLIDLAKHPDFAAGNVHTGFIEDHYATLFPPNDPSPDCVALVAMAKILREQQATRREAENSADPGSPWAFSDGFRLQGPYTMTTTFLHENEPYSVHVTFKGPNSKKGGSPTYDVSVKNKHRRETFFEDLTASINGKELDAHVGGRNLRGTLLGPETDGNYHLLISGKHIKLQVEEKDYSLVHDHMGEVETRAPMPGKIIKVLVNVGDKVVKGQDLLILEAMKMEHKIKSPSSGIVKTIKGVNTQVNQNAVVVYLHDDKNSNKE